MVLKSVKLIIEFAVGALVGAAILAGLIVWRLSGQPISLSFLTPYLEQALSASDGSFTAKLDDTQLTWEGWERTLDIRIRGARAIGPDGQVLASVPEMGVALSINGLLHGVIAPTSLEIFHPKVRVVRGKDGKMQLGIEDSGPKAGEIMTELVEDLIGPPSTSRALGYLTSVRITRADLELIDEKMGTVWHAPKADILLSRDVKGIDAQAALGLDVGKEQAEIDADLAYDRDARKIDVGLTFGNLNPALFSAKQKIVEGLEALAMPLSGTLTGTLDIDGNVESLGFDIAGGPGKLVLPKVYPKAVPVTKVALRGRIEDNMARLVVDRFHADLGGPSVDLNGRIYATGGDLAAQGEVTIDGMPVDSLMRYWPESVAVNARTWIRGHISHGSVPETRAVFALQAPKGDLDALHLDSIAGSFKAQGLTVAYLPPMQPVENVSGRATFTARELDIALDGGTVHGVAINEGRVDITGLDVKDQDAAIEIVLAGPLRDVMAVLDSKPVKAAEFLGVAPADIGGQTALRAQFKLPLEKDLTFAKVRFGAAANIRGASIKNAALHQDLDDGALSVKVDKAGVTADGTIRLGGIPATLAANVNFADTAPFRSRYTLTASPAEADFARLGFPLAPYVTGTVPISLAYVEGLDGNGDLKLSANLTGADMEMKDLGWSKAKGVQGAGHFALTLVHDKPTDIREFSVSAGTLTASGNGAFAPGADGGSRLARLDFTRLAYGRTDVAGRLTFREDGGYAVDLRGPQIDASHFFSVKDVAKEEETKKKGPPLAVSAVADTLWVGEKAKVLNASLALDQMDDRWRSLDFKGALPNPDPKATENQTFVVKIAPLAKANGRSVSVATGDAGLFLKTFGIFDNMLGGQMNLDGTIDDSDADHPFTGRLKVKDYRLTRAPFLAKLLTVASLTGIVNVLSGQGIGFSDLKAPLTLRKDVLTVGDARAYGADIGLTMKGTLNVKTNVADLQGTIVPAYALNTILGNIPIVGDILTGGKGSGVFAATYRLTGDIKDPKVELNPLAALTPGILRNLFDVFSSPDESEAKPPDIQSPQWQNQ